MVAFGSVDRGWSPFLVLLAGKAMSTCLQQALIKILTHASLSSVPSKVKFLLIAFLDFAVLVAQRDYIAELSDTGDVFIASASQSLLEMLRHFVSMILKVRKWSHMEGGSASERAAIPQVAAADVFTDMIAEHVTMIMATLKVLSLDPLWYRLGDPTEVRSAASVMLAYGIQVGFELVADTATLWMSFRMWRRVGVIFPLGAVEPDRWLQAFLAMLSLLCFTSVGYLLRYECFTCSREAFGRECATC